MLKGCGFSVRGLLCVAICAILPQGAYAGWFGPSNYDECLEQKMRAGDVIIDPFNDSVCRGKFPLSEYVLEPLKIQSNWCHMSNTQVGVCITYKPENYSIKRVEVHLSNMCDSNRNFSPAADGTCPDEITLTGSKSWFKDDYIFNLPPQKFNNMWVIYIGKDE